MFQIELKEQHLHLRCRVCEPETDVSIHLLSVTSATLALKFSSRSVLKITSLVIIKELIGFFIIFFKKEEEEKKNISR